MLRSVALLLAALPGNAPAQSPSAVAIADHLAIHSRDADISAEFYKRMFGAQDIPEQLPNTRWVSLGTGFALHIIGGAPARVTAPRMTHLALRTSELEPLIARFEAAGLAWSDFTGAKAIQTRFDGVRQIFVQDPDGYWIEVSDARGVPKS